MAIFRAFTNFFMLSQFAIFHQACLLCSVSLGTASSAPLPTIPQTPLQSQCLYLPTALLLILHYYTFFTTLLLFVSVLSCLSPSRAISSFSISTTLSLGTPEHPRRSPALSQHTTAVHKYPLPKRGKENPIDQVNDGAVYSVCSWEDEAGRLGVYGQSRIHNEFEASLGFIRKTYLKERFIDSWAREKHVSST